MIWWVIYDIAAPKRLKRVAKLCGDAGLRRIQKSVFTGVLSQEQVISLREALLQWVQQEEDRVLMFPISKREIKAAVSFGDHGELEDILHPKAFLIL